MKKSLGFFFVFALVLLTSVLSSCRKEDKLALYYFYCDMTGCTTPSRIENPELREIYTQLLRDFMDDLNRLKMSEIYETTIVGGKFDPEDEKQMAKYDVRLPDLTELEAKYRKRIEDLGEPGELAFIIQCAFILTRTTPPDFHSPVKLKEYAFELRYGYSGFALY